MNNMMEIMNTMNATNATGMASGNQESGDIMTTIKEMSLRFAENVVMNLAAREMAEFMRSCGASAVNSEASAVPPASPSSAVVNTPTAELSPTASVSEVQSPTVPAAAQFEIATISPTIPNAPEPQPSPTVGEQTALATYVNPPVAPDLHERPAASYSSPGGQREVVWDVEERQEESQISRTNGSPKRRRQEEPQYRGEWYALEKLQAELESGKLVELNMTPTALECHIGMLGAHHNFDLSVQSIIAREKEIKKAKTEIIRSQAILRNAPTAGILADWCTTARTVVQSKK